MVDFSPEFAGYPAEIRESFTRFVAQHLDDERAILASLDGEKAIETEEKLRILLEQAFYDGYHSRVLSDHDLIEGEQ